jgi:hypothetical protein
MSAVARRVVRAGSELARERLAAYARYAGLVAEQERALEDEDLERFQTLSTTIRELQEGVDGAEGALHHLDEDPELGTATFVERVSEILRSTLARNERIQTRLGILRRKVAGEVRRVGEGRHRSRLYMEDGTAGSPGERVPSLDVRL